jgi:hypothetical protein
LSKLRLLLLGGALALLAALATPVLAAPAAQAADCQFVLGFKTLHDLIPTIVGDCQENEHFNVANGDSLQATTNGLLVWWKADNHTAFTDGYHTWVNGPDGLQERLNTQRLAWEPNPDHLPIAPSAPPAAAVARCDSGMLTISQDGGGAAVGNVGAVFRLHNTSAAACSLFGYPGAQLLNASRQPMTTKLTWSTAGYLIGTVPESSVVLNPGGDAYFVLEYTDVPSPGETCPAASFLQTTPPDAFASQVIPVRGLAPCGGRITASPILAKNPLPG